MPMIWTFDSVENKHDVYRGEHCMKNLCVSLRQHAREIINFKNKKMIPLTNQEYKLYLNKKNCHICKEKLEDKCVEEKKCCKIKDYCCYTGKYRGALHGICSLKYSTAERIPVLFCNGSNCDHDFITKKLMEEFEREYRFLGENI